VPLVGEVLVEGKTIGEVSKEIAERLQRQTGLLNTPSVSVNIASHGFIYVMGDVQTPGEYPYSTNMTVLQAVTVAGGLRRKADAAFMRLDRDRIAAAGELEEAELTYTRMLIRQARLEAELEEKDDFAVPMKLSEHASGIAKEEHGFMAARNSMLRSKLDTLVDLQALNEQEIVTLDDKIKSQRIQIELAEKELKGVTSLREKGLAVTSRQMALQRELADAESKLLDLEIALVRSKQALKKAERDGEDLRSTHLAEIEKDLQEVRPKLEQAKVQMRTAALLVNEATVTTPAILEAREKNAVRSEPTFAVVREVKGWPEKISADAYLPLRPKDIVEVVIVDAPNAGQSPRTPPGN
jgi:exopolysaccharide production protein ExoF